jgi:hypothetical protein
MRVDLREEMERLEKTGRLGALRFLRVECRSAKSRLGVLFCALGEQKIPPLRVDFDKQAFLGTSGSEDVDSAVRAGLPAVCAIVGREQQRQERA